MSIETDKKMSDATTALALPGAQNVEQLNRKMAQMAVMIELKKKFLKEQLHEGIDRDYAKVPGCGDKLALLKPGAEKLLDWHNYYADFTLVSTKEDWDIGLFAYVYRCEVKQRGSGIVIGVSEGDASTYESKYRFEWRFDNQLPPGTDINSCKKKEFSRRDGSKFFKYQLQIDNLADKRNTVRKMAQKRALVGATVLATATSDLFTTDVDPDEAGADPGQTGNQDQGAASTGKDTAPRDYGNPISDKQAKRLFAIRSNAKIDNDTFNKWLKAKYGLESDREIGWKVYDEICKACESGKLEMPAEKAEAKPEQKEPADKPKQTTPPLAASGPTINTAQIKGIWDAISQAGTDEATFLTFLHETFLQYGSKAGINQILASDYEQVLQAFISQMEGGQA